MNEPAVAEVSRAALQDAIGFFDKDRSQGHNLQGIREDLEEGMQRLSDFGLLERTVFLNVYGGGAYHAQGFLALPLEERDAEDVILVLHDGIRVYRRVPSYEAIRYGTGTSTHYAGGTPIDQREYPQYLQRAFSVMAQVAQAALK